jgi:hypothetical protein
MTGRARRSLTRRTLLLAALCGPAACQTGVGRPAVSLRLTRSERTPRDASVFIDEEFIGPLTLVVVHGVSLPLGKHRITVQKAGYFPWDRLVESDRENITLNVELEPIPD